MVDLVGGPLSVLLDTDQRSGRRSRAPTRWAARWRRDTLAPDGVLYPSRHTGAACLFIYDHAIAQLAVRWRRRVENLPDPAATQLRDLLHRLRQRQRQGLGPRTRLPPRL